MSIEEMQREIAGELDALPDEMDQYTYVLTFGRGLLGMAAEDKTEHTLVKGCQSKVWAEIRFVNGRLVLQLDSDALVIRGLLAMVSKAYTGRTPGEILKSKFLLFDRPDVQRFFPDSRTKGMQALLAQIQAAAEEESNKKS